MTKISYILMSLILIGLFVLDLLRVPWAFPLALALVFIGGVAVSWSRNVRPMSHPGDEKAIMGSNENQSNLLEVSQDPLEDRKYESGFTRSDSNNVGVKLAVRRVSVYPRYQ